MKVLVFGSLNLDYVYRVNHIVQPGETISSSRLDIFPGGKGLNQAIALARAGASVSLAGNVGTDGGPLREVCGENRVDTSHLGRVGTSSGQAIIQVADSGENSILLFGGANQKNTPEYIDRVLCRFSPGDLVVLQNEINLLDVLVDKAAERGLRVALNPSPFDERCTRCDLSGVSLFLLNEVEGAQMTGETEPRAILDHFQSRYPAADMVLTLGREGAVYQTGAHRYRHGIYRVPVVDTTAAGDTFTGFFIAAYIRGETPEKMLEQASVASSLAVSRQGAVPSIPTREEMLQAAGQLQPA